MKQKMKTKHELMNNTRTLLLSFLLLPMLSAPVYAQPAVFPIATNLSSQLLDELSGSAASDGTNFLVGIEQEFIKTNSPVGAQLIAPDGSLAGPFINFSRTGGLPWVACSGTNYLVVWQDDASANGQIFGQIVSLTGTLAGGAFPISYSSAWVDLMGPQVVAYAKGNYLVGWDDYQNGPSSVYGQIVSASGSLVGDNFEIFSSTNSQDAKNADVASDGTNFFVNCLYNSTGEGNHNINRGRFVAVNGTMGDGFDISQSSSIAQNPQCLIFNGTNYLTVWPFASETNSTGNPIWSLHGRFVNPDGTFPGNEFEILGTNAAPMLPVLAFDGANYLLTWTEGMFTSNSMVWMQFLDASGLPFGASFAPFTSINGKVPMFGGAGFGDGHYLALTSVGTNFYEPGIMTFDTPGNEVYGTFIPSSIAPPQAAGPSSYADNHFSFSFSGTPGIPYVIQAATNLASPVWSSLATNIFTNGIIDFTDSSATNRGKFYRVMKQ